MPIILHGLVSGGKVSFKIYEADIHRRDMFYEITELIVERDPERYEGTDEEDINLFHFLIGRGMFGLNIESPIESDTENAFLKGWSGFGRMIL